MGYRFTWSYTKVELVNLKFNLITFKNTSYLLKTCVDGLMVMIFRFQRNDPGPIPGPRIFITILLTENLVNYYFLYKY